MADRVAQGALALTALSSTGDSGATASTQGAGVPSSLSSVQAGTIKNTTLAAVSRIQSLRQSASSTSTLAGIAASQNSAPRQTSTLDTGAIKAALASTSPSSTQEGQARPSTNGSSLKETFRSVADSTSPLQARQASRSGKSRSTAALSALAQGESSALNESPRVRSVAGYGQLDHLDITIEDALTLTITIEG